MLRLTPCVVIKSCIIIDTKIKMSKLFFVKLQYYDLVSCYERICDPLQQKYLYMCHYLYF